MNVNVDDKYSGMLESLAESSGKSVEVVLGEVLERGLANTAQPSAPDVSEWKPRLMRLIEEMRAMPCEGPDDGFSGADHDEVLYPRLP